MVAPSERAIVPCIGKLMPCSRPTDSIICTAAVMPRDRIVAEPQREREVEQTSESVVPFMCGYIEGSTAKVRSRFIFTNSDRKPLCMNIQFSYRNGWQFVCWIGGPPAARTWLKNSGLSIACASSRRFSSFQAGSVLWNSAGTLPGHRVARIPPESEAVAVHRLGTEWRVERLLHERCCASRIKVDGWRGSPEYASQRHMTSSPCISIDACPRRDCATGHMLAAGWTSGTDALASPTGCPVLGASDAAGARLAYGDRGRRGTTHPPPAAVLEPDTQRERGAPTSFSGWGSLAWDDCAVRRRRVAVPAPAAHEKRPGFTGPSSCSILLGYLDSNQEQRYQKPPCCQLHHTPMARDRSPRRHATLAYAPHPDQTEGASAAGRGRRQPRRAEEPVDAVERVDLAEDLHRLEQRRRHPATEIAVRTGPNATRGLSPRPSMRAPRSASSIWSWVHASAGSRSSASRAAASTARGVGGQAGEGVVVVREARGIREQEAEHAGRLAEQADALLHERRGLDEHGLLRGADRDLDGAGGLQVRHGAGGELADVELRMWSPLIASAFFRSKRAGFGLTFSTSKAATSSSRLNTSRSAENPQPSSAR